MNRTCPSCSALARIATVVVTMIAAGAVTQYRQWQRDQMERERLRSIAEMTAAADAMTDVLASATPSAEFPFPRADNFGWL